MTKKEYETILAEAAERVRRTSFPAPEDPRDAEWARHVEHAEYGASQH